MPPAKSPRRLPTTGGVSGPTLSETAASYEGRVSELQEDSWVGAEARSLGSLEWLLRLRRPPKKPRPLLALRSDEASNGE
ncbi:hypothetical protein IscW_ISCW007888 [Ixodes scapularis]|uniref:Uncharacterized protein n=1 Tax=Ixodes scapularis TaxID=6945 RepID=B7PVD6_IXOSC|nr:hypothetical protein IscW_ISCW007888 [Ixodes scapularis]|eukprot:XP_002407852.1 hypothetical protein IscW_ISCW007888 [Ixodes scapularis]